nr:B-cell antigen receptor complex-associated protein beta chain [Pelodiscus sinensis]|eukprot:XP_025039574.1 B-cell antigen receptor complex-associated protein beta chain [Pelodiscus sinensis]
MQSDTSCSSFRQHPRYIAAKKNTQVHFICHSRNSTEVQWYKISGQDKTPQVLDVTGPRVHEKRNDSLVTIILSRIQPEDNGIYLCENKNSTEVQWYKISGQDKTPQVLDVTGPRVHEKRNDSLVTIILSRIQPEDNGIYLCENKSLVHKLGQTRTCGSELKVIGFSTFEQVQSRNTVKDAIIVIQTILLVIFVSVPLLLLLEKLSDLAWD